jgi:GTP1/Obg family GTP-binding protein
MMQRVSDIDTAFSRVKASAEKFIGGDKASRDASFEYIFALNNEIGRLGREVPKTMPRMKELQAYVNLITVGLKYDKMKELREGLSVTEESIRALRREFSSAP